MFLRIFTILLLISLLSCGGDVCFIRDLEVTVGECSCEDSYALTVNFIAEGSDSEYFELFSRNNMLVGHYKLADLPITIDKFEMSGLSDDYLKVRLNEDDECTKEIEFFPPDCKEETGDCLITALEVEVGECITEGIYSLDLFLEYENATNDFFDLFVRNGELIDYYKLSDLPLSLTKFETSGLEYDYLKICINDNLDCCKEIEFMPAICEETDCEISDLKVELGDCTSEKTYELTLNFEYDNATHSNFEVFIRNNERIANYPLSTLPLELDDFALSGKEYDFIKICMTDNPDCCKEVEFMPPSCEENECEIYDLVIEVKECTSDSTYNIVLDFEYENAGNEFFDVYIRQGILIDYFKLSDLPIEIIDFPISGEDYDYLKVCINDVPDCCKEDEFMPPEC